MCCFSSVSVFQRTAELNKTKQQQKKPTQIVFAALDLILSIIFLKTKTMDFFILKTMYFIVCMYVLQKIATPCVAQANLKLMILLPPHSEYLEFQLCAVTHGSILCLSYCTFSRSGNIINNHWFCISSFSTSRRWLRLLYLWWLNADTQSCFSNSTLLSR